MPERLEEGPIANPLVSIIVPIYNSAEYLDRCLNSLKNQSMTNLEVIMVDDGSTDGSAEILRRFIEHNSRFHVITQKNAGAAAARNTGLLYAKGEYIGFVDADDYIALNMFEIMYRQIISTNSDLAVCSYSKVASSGQKIADLVLEDSVLQISELGTDKFYLYYLSRSHALWNKLYRRSIIEEHKISFDLTHGEDLLFNLRILPFLKRVCILSTLLYHYVQHKDSLMGRVGNIDTLNPVYLMSAWSGWKTDESLLPYFVFSNQFTGFLFSAQCMGRPYSFFYEQIKKMRKTSFFFLFKKRLVWSGDLRCIYQSAMISRQFYFFIKICFALCELKGDFLSAALMWAGQKWIAAKNG